MGLCPFESRKTSAGRWGGPKTCLAAILEDLGQEKSSAEARPRIPVCHFRAGLLKLFLKPPHEFYQRDSKNSADLAQLQQIQPPGSRFIVANECLRLAELLGHVRLAETSLPPKLAQHC
jgi:hypothetical protein